MSADLFDSVDWAKLGSPPVDDGSIERVDLDGANRTTIVPPAARTPPNSFISTRWDASSTGVIVNACE
jgi:hypothetical protein